MPRKAAIFSRSFWSPILRSEGGNPSRAKQRFLRPRLHVCLTGRRFEAAVTALWQTMPCGSSGRKCRRIGKPEGFRPLKSKTSLNLLNGIIRYFAKKAKRSTAVGECVPNRSVFAALIEW